MKINVIGLGKLGFPMAKFLSSSNYKIQAFDINNEITNLIRNKPHEYLKYELNLNKKKYSKNKILVFDTILESLSGTSISFLTVPTPSTAKGDFSNQYIISVLSGIAKYIKENYKSKNPYLININSTVSPGSINGTLVNYMYKYGLKNNIDYQFIYNPYFVALGEVINNLERPNFILIGTNDEYANKKITSIYKKIYKKPDFKFLSIEEAELTKILLNCYVTTKISFTNFVNEIATNSNINDCSKILKTLGSDSRIGLEYFNKGGPYSGPCFPRDNIALINYCKKINANSSIPKSTEIINNKVIKNYKKNIVKLRKKFNSIAFLGIGYKKNTDCIDHSIALKLMSEAYRVGFKIYFYDKYSAYEIKNTLSVNLLMI